MAPCFCCSSIEPYRPNLLDHEPKFTKFMAWAKSSVSPELGDSGSRQANMAEGKHPQYAIQLVRQVNYGPLESKRYFIPVADEDTFVEIGEEDLIRANFQKLNSYKNFRCPVHDKFFELNVYQHDPVNRHHWRANLARPATSIDL